MPPYTPEELSALSAECDANAEHMNELDKRFDDLQEEYYSLTGHLPFHRGRSFRHPHAIFADDDDMAMWKYEKR